MRKILTGVAFATLALSTPAHAGTGPDVSRCDWIVSHASANQYNLCYFFWTIPYKRWLH
jgi:hypothetical protein